MALVAKHKYDEDFGEGQVIGTIGFVSLKEIPEDKMKPQDLEYGNTHILSFTVHGLNKSGDPKAEKDSIWFSMGKTGNIRDGVYNRQDANKAWHPFVAGADVRFKYVKNGDFINVKGKDIVITQPAEITQKADNSSGGNSTQKRKFDDTGIKKGHLATCVENLLGAKAYESAEKYATTAVAVQELTDRVKAHLKGLKPEMSDYDLGASGGRAVKEACNHCKSIATAEAFAMSAIALDVDSLLDSIVKGTYGKEPEPVNEAKINPTAPNPEIDLDDDIPF